MMTARATPRRPHNGAQVRADRTRDAVISETVRCILDEGLAAASARHIAERAGVTWGVIQYHFGDRDALLMAVVDKGMGELADGLRHLPPAGAGLPARGRTAAVVGAAWEAFSSPTSMAALEILIGTRTSRDERANEHLADVAKSFVALGRYIGEGLDREHATAIGNLVWTHLRGLVLAQLVVTKPIDTGRDRRALIDTIAAYIEQQEARPATAGRGPGT